MLTLITSIALWIAAASSTATLLATLTRLGKDRTPTCASKSVRGSRHYWNEDEARCEDGYFQLERGKLHYLLAVVADGVSGGGLGALASKAAVDYFTSVALHAVASRLAGYSRPRDVCKALEGGDSDRLLSDIEAELSKAVATTDEAFKARMAQLGLSAGRAPVYAATTLTAALLLCSHVIWVSVGNTRLYVYQNGELRQLTVDDVAVDNPHAVTNVISNLGDRKVQPKTGCLKIEPPARLLLTSDGVHDYIPHEKLAEVLSSSGNAIEAAEAIIAKLQEIYGNNIPDDATVIVIDIPR